MVTPTMRSAQARDRDLLLDHLARRAGDADLGAEEREPPHVHRDVRAVGIQHVRRHRAARRQDVEVRAGRQAAIPQIAGKDAQPVAALLELAPVRVEQAQGERCERLARWKRWPDCDRPPQDAIRADAVVPVADAPDRRPRPGGSGQSAGSSTM